MVQSMCIKGHNTCFDLVIIAKPWPRGYKFFSMLNSAEHEISTAHKNETTDK